MRMRPAGRAVEGSQTRKVKRAQFPDCRHQVNKQQRTQPDVHAGTNKHSATLASLLRGESGSLALQTPSAAAMPSRGGDRFRH